MNFESANSMLARQGADCRYMDELRKSLIHSTFPKNAVLALNSSFEYAKSLPPRLGCGLVEFYEMLARGRR